MNLRRMIWFAIVFSTVIYLVLAVMLTGQTGDFDAAARTSPVPILYGVALMVFITAWFVAPGLVRGNAQTKMIVCLSLFEACAIFGLVAAMLVKDWRLYLAPWALALVGFIRELPRESSHTAP